MFVSHQTLTHKKLFSEKDLTLKKAVTLATAMEMIVMELTSATKLVTELNDEEEYAINCIGKQAAMVYYSCGKRGHVIIPQL